jgi:pyrrolidone-carboxylate peptidase
MPGFSNYDPGIKNPRKEQIEKLDPEEIKFVEVTINGIPGT